MKRAGTQSEELELLRHRLAEAEEALRAIRSGDVDGVIASGTNGAQVYLLEGAEHPYRLFIEAMDEGAITVSPDGVIVFCNRRFAQFLNSSVERIIGLPIEQIGISAIAACLQELLRPDSQERRRDVHFEIKGRSRVLQFITARERPAGSVALLVNDVTHSREREATLRRLNHEMEARVRERTATLARAVQELKREIASRRASEEAARRLAKVVEQAAESIIITDTAGSIEYVNPAFERITGFASHEVVGKNPRILKSGKHDASFYESMWKEILQHGVWHGHFSNVRKDGTIFEEDATISTVCDANGAITNLVAIKHDVTSSMALAAQLRQAQKIEAIGTLAGGVAHDFNNLLQAMMTMVQLVDRDPARRKDHLSHLEQTIHRGAQLTRQLLLFARRERSVPEPLNLNEVMRDLFGFLRRVVRENIRLDIVNDAETSWIRADRNQLEQVIMNLAVNAVDAMPEGGRLTIRARRDSGAAILEISDTGTGIPAAIRDRIFEPFFTTKEAGKGTGLGLAVVHGIVNAHGGQIGFECPSAGGTTFRVEFPLLETDPAAVPLTVEQTPAGRGNGERIVLIEDEDAARDGLCGVLRILGYSVTPFATGEDALAAAGDVSVAAVLSDVMLPGISGFEVVRRLRDARPHLPALLMSGYAAPRMFDANIDAGELRILQKPFDTGDLIRALDDLLHRKEQSH